MRNKIFFIAGCVLCLLCPNKIRAQYRVLGKKSHTPDWMKGVATIPRSNDTYEFVIVDNVGESLQSLEAGKLTALGQKLTQINKISGVIGKTVESSNKDGNFTSEVKHKMVFQTETEVHEFVSKYIDDYWEYVLYPDGSKGYVYYALFAVSKGGTPLFDDISLTTKYGAAGLWRSMIVPGWGQFYKGSPMKGTAILAGEVASVAGILLCENTRASYQKMMIEQPKYAKEYNYRMDTWETARNLCIGAAGAIYIVNLIDALATKGAKRVKVKSKGPSFSMSPYADANSAGVGMAWTF